MPPALLEYTAFADAPGGGNPAGVVLNASGLDAAAMLALAAEVGFSETAFVTAEPAPGHYDVRYFAPHAEVPFCGHATIATAVALADRDGPGPITILCAAGSIPVETAAGPTGMLATLTSVPPLVEAAPPGLVERALGALGWSAGELDAALPPRVAFAGARHLVLAAATRERLARLDYAFDTLRALCVEHDLTTVDLVWRESELVFHARNPFPVGGVVEDPATGAAAAALAGYLRALELVRAPVTLTVLQGLDMGRPSRLTVGLDADTPGVRVTGTARRLDQAEPATSAAESTAIATGTVAVRRAADTLRPRRSRPARRGRRAATDDALAVARALPLDAEYLREVVEHLAGVGSSPLGFRTTGTPEDSDVADWVAGELRGAGLSDVGVEEVEVDGWRFEDARLVLEDGVIVGAALGGTPATDAGGARGPLLDGGGGTRRELDRLDVRGALVLVDWRQGRAGPSDVGLELGLRGAAGVVVAPAPGGPYFQADGALGTFDGHWHSGAPPMMTVRMTDAAGLRAQLAGGPRDATLTVRVTVSPQAKGHNAVGYLPGEREGPIVVGAHHDGWFHAAFDNATGVAAMLGIARGLAAAGHVPRHRICFTSRTAEEYGLLDRTYDWCVGAWRQADVTHPEWGEQAPFHLCLEASGHPGLRLALEAPVELTRWARRAGRLGAAEGWLTSGWRTSPPVTGTEQWPLLVSGVPGVAAYNWEPSFAKGLSHTPLDTPDIVDSAHLERLTRFYAFVLLDADADPDAILDHAARGRQLAKRARALGDDGEALRSAAEAHGSTHGRAAFTRVGRELHAVAADGSTGYPDAQAALDIAALEAALEALRADDRLKAIRELAKIGDNVLSLHLSHAAFVSHQARLRRQHDDDSWAARSHLTASPGLWEELAALRGEPGARAVGSWIEDALEQHLERSGAERTRRVDAMARALTPPQRPDPGRSS